MSVADPDHPLVAGMEAFEATDEQYLMHTYGDLKVLLETEFGGDAPGFRDDQWADDKHPVFYIKEQGKGAVLYLTLGHCRHHYDMQPLMDYWPTIERCAWDTPQFYDLLRRGLSWAMEPVENASLEAAKQARENAPEL